MTAEAASRDEGAVLKPGDRVLGLEIRRICGSGGFGTVYEAFDPGLERPVAVKVLHSAEPRVRRRFRDEGRALARLVHPHIVQVHAVGELPSGQPALVMQFVPGGALSDHVRPGKRWPFERTAMAMGHVLEALAAAHEAGICHRDVKAANVLWSPEREVALLCDFGIARLLDAPPTEPTAGLVGSRQSLSPERLRGVADDPRSDLFAAGALLYRLLSGREPFDAPGGDLVALAERMARPPPELPAETPERLVRLCQALLAHEPSHRPTAADAALMLRGVFTTEPTVDPPVVPPAVSRPHSAGSPTRRPRPSIRFAVLAGVATLVLGAALWGGAEPQEPEQSAHAQPVPAPRAPPPDSQGSGPAAAQPAALATTAAVERLPSLAAPRSGPAAPSRSTRSDRAPRNQNALDTPFIEP